MLARRDSERDSISVSLITCWPGREIFELCGHEALRIRGQVDGHQIDSVWNYGIFDFNSPNFVGRFVKGETDYKVLGYPFAWFPYEYVMAGRRVEEQDLNLTQAESRRLLDKLRWESRPENNTYRYNYVRDNCATRIITRIDSAAQRRVIYPDSVKFGSFRNEMRAYHANYPWYQFGIDLALGSGLDAKISARQEMFVPVELYRNAARAHFSDGSPFVRHTRVLNAGNGEAVLGPTPWYLTPLVIFSLLFVLSVWVAIAEVRRSKVIAWATSIWFAVTGLVGCVIAFLVFVSTHDSSSPNILILLLNPLQLITAVAVCSRRLRGVAKALTAYNIIIILAVGTALLVAPSRLQVLNLAFLPIAGVFLALSAGYLLTIIKSNGNEKFNVDGAVRSGNRSRSSATRGNAAGAAKARGRNRD